MRETAMCPAELSAYLLLGAAPIEGGFSGVVDIPNSRAGVLVPLSARVMPTVLPIERRRAAGIVHRLLEIRTAEAVRPRRLARWCHCRHG